MDLYRLIKELRHELFKVDRSITALEELEKSDATNTDRVKGRRGRKNMGPEERKKVAERMKKYWANRRENGRESKSQSA